MTGKSQENSSTQVATRDGATMSQRFMNAVASEFAGKVGAGTVALTEHQKRLAQNYFLSVDQALQKAEIKRLNKNNNQDALPVTWANVNMQQLALDVVAAARVGLDPAQSNQIYPIPYKNNRTKQYDITLMPGYRGIELAAVKYGLDVPDSVIVELVHKHDRFRPIKKSLKNPVESYEFDIENPFDRGAIVGGFYYHAYKQNPEKNKLVIFSLEDILKRKPEYASVEFWGKPEQQDGWFEKMCDKTIRRAAYKDITIDPQKIDSDYLRLKRFEESVVEQELASDIEANANGDFIDIEATVSIEPPQLAEPENAKNEEKASKNSQKQGENEQKTQKSEKASLEDGPGF